MPGKPLPTKLKLIRGTARPSRLNPAEPQLPVCVPDPPAHLAEAQRAAFTEMAEMLARRGLMTELDARAVARYAVIWCRWVNAEAEVNKSDVVVKTGTDKDGKGGNIIQNPYLGIANRCLVLMAQIESEFGMTPASRARVAAGPPAVAPGDKFDAYLNRGRKK